MLASAAAAAKAEADAAAEAAAAAKAESGAAKPRRKGFCSGADALHNSENFSSHHLRFWFSIGI